MDKEPTYTLHRANNGRKREEEERRRRGGEESFSAVMTHMWGSTLCLCERLIENWSKWSWRLRQVNRSPVLCVEAS